VEPKPAADPNELRAFLWVLRRALLMICRYVDKRYPESG